MRRAVLFDLDDTLFDHRRSARAALQEVHRVHAPAFEFGAFERHHMKFLEEMHLEVLAGRIGLDDARRERFRKVFAALGVALGAVVFRVKVTSAIETPARRAAAARAFSMTSS